MVANSAVRRVWMDDVGELSNSTSHGARVWATFTACAVRSTENQYFVDNIEFKNALRADGRDLIQSLSSAPLWEDVPFPDPGVWADDSDVPRGHLNRWHDGNHTGQRVLRVEAAGNDGGKRTSHLQDAPFQLALQDSDIALWILVGGYVGEGEARKPADTGLSGGSSVCGDADPLCLFGPWTGENSTAGTSASTPQVAAALDTVWAVWPDMDVLDLRNLAFDCAENMPSPAGEESMVREYSYLNGRGFTSATNSRWGHGILSLTCLFTPNGGLQDPTTGNAISGGIYGPLAGPITGASITGVDYTGRDFGYGFARTRWPARIGRSSATANLSAVLRRFSGNYGPLGLRLAAPIAAACGRGGTLRMDLTAAADRRSGRSPTAGRATALGAAAAMAGRAD